MSGADLEALEWDEQKAKNFASIYLLHQLQQREQIPLLLNDNDQFVEPLLEDLHSKGYIAIQGDHYQLAEHGEQVLQRFASRYQEYLRFYDVFCAVELSSGEFAFAKYFDFDSDAAWGTYLAAERWEDLRIAVARLKKLDVHEIVFMSFLNEGRFGADEHGWQFELMLGSIWDEIRQICRTAITATELGGEPRLTELTRQGSELMIELLEHEKKLQEWRRNNESGGESGSESDGENDGEVEIEEYYPYRDPFYVSPFWLLPLFFL